MASNGEAATTNAPNSKRPKLSGAFSAVTPPAALEVARDVGNANANGAATVFMLAPTNDKYNTTSRMAVVAMSEQCGSVVVIEQEKKPSFAFASPSINDTSVAGYAYLGYWMASGFNSTTPTSTCAFMSDAQPKFTFKSDKGLLKPVVPKASELSAIEEQSMKMNELPGTWGTTVPIHVIASNTSAFFGAPSFIDAVKLAAMQIDVGATTNGVLLVTDDESKRVQLKSARIQYPLQHLPHMDRYVLLLNPSDDCKYGAIMVNAEPGVDKRPVTMQLRHKTLPLPAKTVQVWQSTLEAAGIVDLNDLYTTPVFLYIDASLDAYRPNAIKLMVTAVATPPPDVSSFVVFSTSRLIKAHFNDLVYNAEEGKMYPTDSVEHLVHNEDRAVPLTMKRVSNDESLLLYAPATVKMVKAYAAACSNTGLQSICAMVKATSDEVMIAAIQSVDGMQSYKELPDVLQALETEADKESQNEDAYVRAVCALYFVASLLHGGKEGVLSLAPNVVKLDTKDAADAEIAPDAEEDDDL